MAPKSTQVCLLLLLSLSAIRVSLCPKTSCGLADSFVHGEDLHASKASLAVH